MPRPRKSGAGVASLAPGQAAWVLNRLIKDRRISAGEVNRYVADMGREIAELEAQLAQLRAASGGAASAAAAPAARARRGRKAAPAAATAAAPAKAAPAKRRRRKVSAEQLQSQKLQGRYLGLVRQFPESKRAYFAKVAKDKGREVAIKEMLDARKK
jgi:hypothetical protein